MPLPACTTIHPIHRARDGRHRSRSSAGGHGRVLLFELFKSGSGPRPQLSLIFANVRIKIARNRQILFLLSFDMHSTSRTDICVDVVQRAGPSSSMNIKDRLNDEGDCGGIYCDLLLLRNGNFFQRFEWLSEPGKSQHRRVHVPTIPHDTTTRGGLIWLSRGADRKKMRTHIRW